MKKMIAVCGGDSQVGTTMVALSIAEVLGKQGKKVLVVSASRNPGNDYVIKHRGMSIDDLRQYLDGDEITLTELKEAICQSRYMDIIPAVRSRSSSINYRKNALALIRKAAESYYDFIIADGGCGEEGLAASALIALEEGDCLCFVVTQQAKCLNRFMGQKGYFAQYGNIQSCYLVNKFIKSATFPSMEQMQKHLNAEGKAMYKIPYVPYGWQAEAEGETLMRCRSFAKAIERAVEYIDKGEKNGNH